MEPELEEKLFSAHPILYRDRDKTPLETLICYGIDCDNGWFDILMLLSDQIENYNRQDPDNPVVATQVKSKFGELRFYIHGGDDYIADLIEKATQESLRTCEICGSTSQVTQNKDGWIETLCKSCRKKAEA